MNATTFMVTDHYELMAMQRVFREAKFCLEADDNEVSCSPTVARLFQRLMNALIASQEERNGDGLEQQWSEWMIMNETRDEWAAALSRAKKEDAWGEWSDEERRAFACDLLNPFIFTEQQIDRFVDHVGKARWE